MSKPVEKIYAFVDEGVVSNTVVINDPQVVKQLKKQHDDVVLVGQDSRAGIGYTYSPDEGFRPPKPFPSWVWNKENFWEAPVAAPEPSNADNPETFEWNESDGSWQIAQWWLDLQNETEENG